MQNVDATNPLNASVRDRYPQTQVYLEYGYHPRRRHNIRSQKLSLCTEGQDAPIPPRIPTGRDNTPEPDIF